MKNVAELFDLEVPGSGWVSWNVCFDEMAPRFPRENVSVRDENPEHPEYAPGECAKRCAIISTSGRICGVDAAVDLNFRDDHLCAVHYHFRESPEMQGKDYESLVDCLRSKLSASLGSPSASKGTGGEVWLGFKWSAADLHVELQASAGETKRIEMAANDPSSCPSCFTFVEAEVLYFPHKHTDDEED